MRRLSDQRDQLDAIHARHVDVGNDQVELFGTNGIPAIHAIDRHSDLIAAIGQQLALQFAHSQRVVHHQHFLACRAGVFTGGMLDVFQLTGDAELLDRAQHIGHVQNQYRRAVFHQGTGLHVGDLAQTRIERLHDKHTFTQETVDCQAVGVFIVADDHHHDRLTSGAQLAFLQNLMRADEADLTAFEMKVLITFEHIQLIALQLQRAIDVGQRESIGLVVDADQQAADHRQGKRQLQLETCALSHRAGDAHGTAHLLEHVGYDIEADAAARNLGDSITQTETRQQQKIEQLRLAQTRHDLFGGQLAIDDTLLETIKIYTGAVVDNVYLQHAGAMPCFQRDLALLRLTGLQALRRRFDAMVDSIAQQMADGRIEFFQNVAIDLGGVADDFQPYRFTQRMSDIAHHARVVARPDTGAVGKRAHAASQCFFIKTLRQIDGMTVKRFQFGQLIGD